MRDGLSIIDTSKEHLSDAGAAITPIVPEGALLLSFKLSLGKLAFAGKALRTNEAIAALIPNDKELLTPEFLYWYLKSFDWASAARGSEKVKGATLNKAKLKEIPIPLPALCEQKRIVAILDEAFEGIAKVTANAERNLANAREWFSATVSSIFEAAKSQPFQGQATSGKDTYWIHQKLKEICIVDWGNTDLTKASFVEGGKYLGVSAAGCDGRMDHAEHKAGTPVLSAIGARCGAMFFPEEDFTAIKNTITLTPREAISDGRFLYHLFNYIKLPKRGSAQPFISKGDIQSFEVFVPPIEEQKRLAAVIDEAHAARSALELHYSARVAALSSLRQSLLHKAFSGQLTGKEAIAA